MSTKHTPGPWKWDGDPSNYNPNDEAPWIVAGKLDEIAVLQGEITCQNPADAQLMVAAPELLEALILMVRTHDEPAESLLQEMREQQWLEKARAVIQKAEGQA